MRTTNTETDSAENGRSDARTEHGASHDVVSNVSSSDRSTPLPSNTADTDQKCCRFVNVLTSCFTVPEISRLILKLLVYTELAICTALFMSKGWVQFVSAIELHPVCRWNTDVHNKYKIRLKKDDFFSLCYSFGTFYTIKEDRNLPDKATNFYKLKYIVPIIITTMIGIGQAIVRQLDPEKKEEEGKGAPEEENKREDTKKSVLFCQQFGPYIVTLFTNAASCLIIFFFLFEGDWYRLMRGYENEYICSLPMIKDAYSQANSTNDSTNVAAPHSTVCYDGFNKIFCQGALVIFLMGCFIAILSASFGISQLISKFDCRSCPKLTLANCRSCLEGASDNCRSCLGRMWTRTSAKCRSCVESDAFLG